MQRLLIIYNPRSSRYADVKREVLARAKALKGYMVGKYQVKSIPIDQNISQVAKIIKDGDLVLAAGGDATAVIAANGILQSGKDVTLAVLPYGNFNDLSRTLGTRTFDDVFSALHSKGQAPQSYKFYPLEITVDGELFRYATCYVTIGMTAEAVEIFDRPDVRSRLKSSFGRHVGSYLSLARWYFGHRRRQFIPEFRLNGALQHPQTSDYAAVNGGSMARVMRGHDDSHRPRTFRSETDRLTHSWRLARLMCRSIFAHIPGSETTGDTLEFTAPATVELQAEGEYRVFHDIHQIKIKKAPICLKVIKH